ncbi:MAG: CDP-alcohol phosphatidyltransferase family protein [Deltaproteobacteria bacterium]|nr:CDP-alcohol phosphatidyltransferase family protein [Deltaproteobacteria bacterium]
MPIYAHILHESPILLWGLTSRQRLERVLKRAGVTDFIENLESIPNKSSVLLIRGDYLFDDRVINGLVETNDVVLETGSGDARVAVAVNVPSSRASQAFEVLNGLSTEASLPGVRVQTPAALCSSYMQQLRKSDPPFVLPVTQTNRRDLEKRLFSSSYKGVTDLITKWAWPCPAQWCTGLCARYGLRPNHVTFLSFVLVILAGIFFAQGKYGWGLLAGWVMTFLDTVDGKLARVTVTSSRSGHLFDHLIDLIHPPIWYVLWGLGLAVSHVGMPELTLNITLWVIVGGYVAGRLIELTFTLFLGDFGIFCWHPIDSYFRLITARRNPNLILLTAGAATGYPDLGLLAVAFWTGLTSFFLLIRLVMAGFSQVSSGPLHSWLLDVEQGTYDRSMAKRLFTRRAETHSGDKHE